MKNLLAWLVAIFTVTFVISPAFTPPFMGFTADQLPIPQLDPPIQPAGYTFSVWGLIYGWLIVSAVFGLWKRADDAGWDRARVPLLVSVVIGTPWLAIANASAIWATITIFAMMVTAVIALLRAPTADRWWLQAPVGLYAGWLTAASFVSLGSTAAGYGVAFGALGWAYTGIIGALIVALIVFRQRISAPEYLLVLVWALFGIIMKNAGVETGVVVLCSVGIAALLSAVASRQKLAV